MASMCKIQIIGNVGREPELRMTPNGRPVCEFSVAVNRVQNSGAERTEQTDWYRVSCWGKQAEIAQQYITKGQQIYVDGRFTPRQYTSKEGENRYSFDISCNDFQMLGSRRDREGGMGGGAINTNEPKTGESFDPDEIPF
ncbi:MAG: single-stranded DNA-binding protein [Candidatus Rokubacteria bacterium]|nr:single-stranded DNA-binding protein [Candidatus Rokubacteria bacterium]